MILLSIFLTLGHYQHHVETNQNTTKYSHLLHNIIKEYSIIQVFVLQCLGIRWLEGFNLSSQRQKQQKYDHTLELYYTTWNSLPQDIRHCSTLSSFKAKLKTFLFSQYFHPN